MAQVDFSNAVLDVNPASGTKPFPQDMYMDFNYTAALFDSSGGDITTSYTKSILSNTPSKVSFLYAGTFTASGTEFYIGHYAWRIWKVSNISFSSGDTYAFVIDIEVGGNT